MAVAFDAGSQGDQSFGTSLTFSHTCTGADRLLSVGLKHSQSPTLTYASVGMTLIKSQLYIGSAACSAYQLVAPATGDNNVDISVGTNDELIAAAASFTGVHQTTPLGTAVSQDVNQTSPSNLSVTSATDELAVDFVAYYNQTGLAAGGSQTERVSNDNAAALASARISTQPGAATVSMDWSWTTLSEGFGHVGVSLKPAAAGGAQMFLMNPSRTDGIGRGGIFPGNRLQ